MSADEPIDDFVRRRLPPPELLPELVVDLPSLAYPPLLNAVATLLDDAVARGWGARPCFIGADETWSYAAVLDIVSRLGTVLRRSGVIRGSRVLLRGPNNPMMLALWLAVVRSGAVAVATMPMLRAKELAEILERAAVGIAFCDHRLLAELEAAAGRVAAPLRIVAFGGVAPDRLEVQLADAVPGSAPAATRADDPALIAFTSGTTGSPKGCVHFHRDLLAIADTFSRHVLKPRPDDVFCGSPPIAFTFGLGGLLIFPLRVGAATVLVEAGPPESLARAIGRHKVTICFTAPTAYRVMLEKAIPGELASLRRCVSAGEALPPATRTAFRAATGLDLIDGIGGTELLHIFIAAADEAIRPGAVGLAVPGFRAEILDEAGTVLPHGEIGQLGVRGPLGCRYLDDPRQASYVRHGWNMTGDSFRRDADGYFHFEGRSDDMIVSAGYNIAGPEVEAVLLEHRAVAECAVVASPDADRGFVVKAFVVAAADATGSEALAIELQQFVKARIAPYKYPRAVEFVAALPRTETGKLQRFRLRQQEAARMRQS